MSRWVGNILGPAYSRYYSGFAGGCRPRCEFRLQFVGRDL